MQKYVTVIFSIAIGLAIAPLGLVAAFGQEVEESELAERMQQFVDARAEKLNQVMQKFGFSGEDFEYNPELQKLTISGYASEVDIHEDLAAVIAEHYGFQIIDYTVHENGTYFVAVYNNTDLVTAPESILTTNPGLVL